MVTTEPQRIEVRTSSAQSFPLDDHNYQWMRDGTSHDTLRHFAHTMWQDYHVRHSNAPIAPAFTLTLETGDTSLPLDTPIECLELPSGALGQYVVRGVGMGDDGLLTFVPRATIYRLYVRFVPVEENAQ